LQTINAPAQRLLQILTLNQQRLVGTLDQIKQEPQQ
jgi:hypothetical protein